ncbi:hypothetical protein I4U23_025453 [Adineta vaga]|nr:hypothetical protein I4U23_025453 [Adineta vaga]
MYCYTLYGHHYFDISSDEYWCYLLFYVSGCKIQIFQSPYFYFNEDYHCQIVFYNICGLLTGLALVHMVLISLTMIHYIYMVVSIRKHSQTIRSKQQRIRERRDFSV